MFYISIGPPLHPYEEERLRQCIQNSARLWQLGIPGYTACFARDLPFLKTRARNIREAEETLNLTMSLDKMIVLNKIWLMMTFLR